ncbi:MAG: STAS domain-containing protein [Desulfotignum sp.]|nr:STAS domain-containing protein [Desulfotignum sp.]MCF8125461.1 STAS domain-containing protein [Desulfotignum sp.]
MEFHIETVKKNNAVMIRVEGEVDMFTSPGLRDTLVPFFKKKVDAIIVDLSKVSFMDSSGIATLVEGLQWSRAHDRQFILAGLGSTVFNALSLTKLDHVFTIQKNADQALAAITRNTMKEN